MATEKVEKVDQSFHGRDDGGGVAAECCCGVARG